MKVRNLLKKEKSGNSTVLKILHRVIEDEMMRTTYKPKYNFLYVNLRKIFAVKKVIARPQLHPVYIKNVYASNCAVMRMNNTTVDS